MSNESTNIIETMSSELEHLRPMEASLEMAEADVKAYKQRIAVLEKEVERLKNERWISTGTILPRWGELVKIKFRDGSEDIRRFSHDYKWVSKGMATCESTEVTHWMPLPSAPKEDK